MAAWIHPTLAALATGGYPPSSYPFSLAANDKVACIVSWAISMGVLYGERDASGGDGKLRLCHPSHWQPPPPLTKQRFEQVLFPFRIPSESHLRDCGKEDIHPPTLHVCVCISILLQQTLGLPKSATTRGLPRAGKQGANKTKKNQKKRKRCQGPGPRGLSAVS